MSKNNPQQDRVIAILKNRLVTRMYQPGDRLPPLHELEQELSVSHVTLSRAVKVLKAEEFVTTIPRGGIYVRMNLPFTCRFALVFRHSPESSHWNSLYRDILIGLKNIHLPDGVTIQPIFRVVPENGNHEYQELCRDLNGRRWAGLIFTPELFASVNKYFLRPFPELRHVYLRGIPEAGEIPAVDIDTRQLWQYGLDSLRHRGCNRIGIIDKLSGIDYLLENYTSLAGDISRKRIVAVPENRPEILHNLTQLLLDSKPDGLIVGENVFLSGVIAAAMSAGRLPGHDLMIVAHANRSGHTLPTRDIRRIGFHIRDLLLLCLAAMRHPRNLVPHLALIPARFDDE